jgi:arylsulfatase A
MKRFHHTFFCVLPSSLLSFVVTCCAFVVNASAASKPNIIFILADDMGYGDCSAYNPESKIRTPNIDRLAREGLRFTDAHSAAAVCTPSRYGLLSGTCPARTNISNFTAGAGPVIARDETTIADLLKDQGYATHMIGKWHLGFDGGTRSFDFSKPLTGGPLDCGFDSFYGINKAPSSPPYFYIRGREPEAKPDGSISGNDGKGMDRREIYRQGEAAPGFKPEEVCERFCQEAGRIIRDHAESDRKQPFFLYYALTSPHSPWMPTEKFKGRSEAGNYGDFIVQLDDEVGRVTKALQESGLEKETLFIFSSDNGPMWRDDDKEKFGHHASGVFREHKASPYEGGHRVPFIVRWPGRIAPGTISESTINFTDFFASLSEMFGVNFRKDYPGMARDSFSFYPALFEPEKRIPRPPMIVGNYSLRMNDWKLVARKAGRKGTTPAISEVKIYNLAEDLSEQTDLARSRPEHRQMIYDHYRTFMDSRELAPAPSAKKKEKQGERRSQPTDKKRDEIRRQRTGLLKKLDNLLTPQQKQAQTAAREEAVAEGKGGVAVRRAMDQALKLSPDQKKQFNQLRKEISDLTRQLRN